MLWTGHLFKHLEKDSKTLIYLVTQIQPVNNWLSRFTDKCSIYSPKKAQRKNQQLKSHPNWPLLFGSTTWCRFVVWGGAVWFRESLYDLLIFTRTFKCLICFVTALPPPVVHLGANMGCAQNPISEKTSKQLVGRVCWIWKLVTNNDLASLTQWQDITHKHLKLWGGGRWGSGKILTLRKHESLTETNGCNTTWAHIWYKVFKQIYI